MDWRSKITVPGTEAVVEAFSSATDVAGMAVDKLLELVDEYGKVVAILEQYGFRVGQFAISMGIPPEARTSIEGSIADLPEDKVKEFAEAHKDERIIAMILNTILLAKRVHQRVSFGFDTICLHLTIALKPSIEWEFKK